MKESLEYKKKIITMSNLKNNIKKNLKDILKQLFELENIGIIDDGSNKYLIKSNGEKICNFSIDNFLDIYVLKILIDKKNYTYYINETNTNIKVDLKEYNNYIDKTIYNIHFYSDKSLIHINNNNKYLYLEVDNIEKEKVINVIESISVEDNLVKIYDKVATLSNNNTLNIRKTKIENASYTNNDITDLIVLRNGNLIEFKMTTTKENRKYVIERCCGEYKIIFTSPNLENYESSYFDIGSSISFAKKLEKKK